MLCFGLQEEVPHLDIGALCGHFSENRFQNILNGVQRRSGFNAIPRPGKCIWAPVRGPGSGGDPFGFLWKSLGDRGYECLRLYLGCAGVPKGGVELLGLQKKGPGGVGETFWDSQGSARRLG